jgi:hypothetical protein
MKKFLFILFTLFAFACGQVPPTESPVVEGKPITVEQADNVIAVSVGTNSIKCQSYQVLNRSILGQSRIDKQNWENDYSSNDLLSFMSKNANHSPNTYFFFSQGYQNYYGTDLQENVKNLGYQTIWLTGEEESFWEWHTLTGRSANKMTIGVGGGSTQLGLPKYKGKYQGWSIPFGSRLSVTEEQWPLAKKAIEQHKIPTEYDAVLVTGGAIFHGLWMLNGALPDNTTEYSTAELDDLIDILATESFFNRISENTHDPEMNRIGMLNGIKIIKHILELGGYHSFYLAPNKDWSENLALSIYTQTL